MRPTKQVYSDYTEQDFRVWKILFERQMQRLKNVVSESYLMALEEVNFMASKIPDFNDRRYCRLDCRQLSSNR